MLNLSPLKLLIVLIVALLVAGPDKLPQIARQLGGAWKAFRSFSTKLEEEIRSSVPDLPSTGDLARFARSPVALLDKLAQARSQLARRSRSSLGFGAGSRGTRGRRGTPHGQLAEAPGSAAGHGLRPEPELRPCRGPR